jgi:hypothetical protein
MPSLGVSSWKNLFSHVMFFTGFDFPILKIRRQGGADESCPEKGFYLNVRSYAFSGRGVFAEDDRRQHP